MQTQEEQLPLGAAIEADVVTERPAQALVAATGPANLLEIISRAASDPQTDVEKMERLVGLYERLAARDAEAAFNAAMTACQAEIKRVLADATNPQTRSKYSSYEQIDRQIRPVYTSHGFSLSFSDGETTKPDHVRVVCVIRHQGGHKETHWKDMPADGKGAKGGDVMTKTHAAGAAQSYGQRYLVRGIFNLATGEDDDGNSNGGQGERTPPPRPQRKSEVEAEKAKAERSQAEHAQAKTSAPEVPARCFLVEVAEKSGETKGKPWRLWLIVTDGHESFVTFHESVAKLAKSALENDEAVVFVSEPRPKGSPQITSLTVVATGETAGA